MYRIKGESKQAIAYGSIILVNFFVKHSLNEKNNIYFTYYAFILIVLSL